MVAEAHHEVACCLSGPRSAGVGRDTCEIHPSCRVFDDEQDMESTEQSGVDTGESR